MEKIRIEQVEPRFAHELETPLKNTLKKLGYSIPELSAARFAFAGQRSQETQ